MRAGESKTCAGCEQEKVRLAQGASRRKEKKVRLAQGASSMGSYRRVTVNFSAGVLFTRVNSGILGRNLLVFE